MKNAKLFLMVYLLISVLSLSGTAGAQSTDPIISMRLETDTLALDSGEIYTFAPEIITEVRSGYTSIELHLFSSDEAVVKPGPEMNSIEAVGGGQAAVYIFTSNFEASSICNVTVTGETGKSVSKTAWTAPSAEQMKKITDPSLKAFFEMLNQPEMSGAASILAKTNRFRTIVRVNEGRAESLAAAMKELGMRPVYAFQAINKVAVTGTAEQYLVLMRSEGVLSIDEDKLDSIDADDTRSMLEGQAEAISHFGSAYSIDLDGSGTIVAILDTGIDDAHEQFTEKEDSSIIYQACFSSQSSNVTPTCKNGTDEDLESAGIGSQIQATANFTHGTHVAAIAAGKDGVAPKADIIAVNVFHEYETTCTEYTGEVMTCRHAQSYISDQIRGFDYLNGLLKDGNLIEKAEGTGEYEPLSAINMSLGGGKYSKQCTSDDRESYLKAFLNNKIVTAVAAGNNAYNGSVNAPACAPSAFTVGALWDSGDPQVADFSNHAKLVNIMAPGTQVYSAVEGTDAYEAWNGTSMATPMVTGAVALLRQALPDVSGKSLQTILTGLATQTAVRNNIKIPALNLTNINTVIPFLANGPEISIYGGNKALRLDFSTISYNTNYTVNVYLTDETLEAGKLVKKATGKNLKSMNISGLTNDQPYLILIDGTVTISGDSYSLPQHKVYGMPMTQGSGFVVTQSGTDTLTVSWTPQDGAQLTASCTAASLSEAITVEAETSAEVSDVPMNEQLTVTFNKAVDKYGIRFLSLPTVKTIVTVSVPKLIYSGVGYGKVWLSFEKDAALTSRTVEIWTASPEKKTKTLTVANSKIPSDIVITGLKDGTSYYFKVYNLIKVGKTTYTSEAYTSQVYTPGSGVYYPIDSVTLTAGDKSAKLTYSKDHTIDGYIFEVKPIVPNHSKLTMDIAESKVEESATLTGLTNGWVYKLRFAGYKKNGKTVVKEPFYPYTSENLAMTKEDNAWRGLIFIPLPLPQYTITPGSDSSNLKLTVTNESAADGVIALIQSETPGASTSIYRMEWKDGDMSTFNISSSSTDRNVVLMLYKDYDGVRYYGPAVNTSDIIESESAYGYGPKSAWELDFSELPEFADAGQIDGKVVFPDFDVISKDAPDEITVDSPDAEETAVEAATEDDLPEDNEMEGEEPAESIESEDESVTVETESYADIVEEFFFDEEEDEAE